MRGCALQPQTDLADSLRMDSEGRASWFRLETREDVTPRETSKPGPTGPPPPPPPPPPPQVLVAFPPKRDMRGLRTRPKALVCVLDARPGAAAYPTVAAAASGRGAARNKT